MGESSIHSLSRRTLVLMLTYGIASASMLVVNKAAITIIPEPSLLLLTQVGSTALLVAIPASMGITPSAVRLVPDAATAKAYFMVALVFLATIYCNIRMLQYVGVNAFVVMRCSTPLVVSVLDYVLMGRELPSRRSAAALAGVLACGSLYVLLRMRAATGAASAGDGDAGGRVAAAGMFWSAAWFVSFLTDMLFVKHVCDTHPANGMERTLYQNALATPVLALALAVGADGSGSASEAAGTLVSEITGLAMVLASCLAGLCLSYTGLSLRSEVSSTAFAVLGVVCKMGSIILNELFVDPERDLFRLLVVVGVIVCSSQYSQAPKRPTEPQRLVEVELADDEERGAGGSDK